MRTSQPSQQGLSPWRLFVVSLALLLGFAVVVGRLVQVQVLHGAQLKQLAEDQYLKEMELSAPRGDVLDRQGRTLAVSVAVESVFVDPRHFDKSDVGALAQALAVAPREIRKRMGKRKSFAWIKRRIAPVQADAVRALKLKGVYFSTESKRYYPNRELAAHVLGFVGVDGKGLAGVEREFDQSLRGRSADVGVLRDAHGRRVSTGDILPVQNLEGDDLYLTIDAAIQQLTEEALAQAVASHHAKAGIAVVLDPRDGAILAMANVPTYNPNDAGKAKASARRDRVVTDVFEPGSTVKPLIVAAAMDAHVVQANDVFDCEKGAYKVGRHTIRDTHRYDTLSVSDIIAKSSNIGALKIGARLGAGPMYSQLRQLGFGQKTGLQLPGEVKGILAAPKHWSAARLATISFGQGIGVTAIQLTAAIAAIAADGVWHQPYVVQRRVASDGSVLYVHQPVDEASDSKKVRRVFSAKTAQAVATMMEGVVAVGGTGPRAAIHGLRVAGKTGTSQKADLLTGGYSVDKRIGSFVGFAPVEAPRAVVLVSIDEPQGMSYGGVVAAPAFREIMRGTLAHLGISVEEDDQALLAQEPEDEEGQLTVGGIIAVPAAVPVVAKTDGRVPDLRGLDLRRAAAAALSLGLELRIVGRGRVVEQAPPAGASLEGVEELHLQLRAEEQG